MSAAFIAVMTTGFILWVFSMQLAHLIREGTGVAFMFVISLLLSLSAGSTILIIAQTVKETVNP